MGERKKILFYSEGWGTGGIESFIMNAVRVLDPSEYSFEIFCTHDYDDGHDDEIKALGGIRHVVFEGRKPNLATRTVRSVAAWKKLLVASSFDIVHINTMNGVGFLYAEVARREGVPTRIVHSHNTDFGDGHKAVKLFFHSFGKRLFAFSATHRIACSTEAGAFLFDEKKFDILNNAIDLDRFAFNRKDRLSVREDLSISQDAFVVGNVARLEKAKNPLFLLSVFSELEKKQNGCILLLVGQGFLRKAVEQEAERLGIGSSIRIVPSTNDVPAFLSAMDVLCAPSLYEGLPVSFIEAQAAGLPILCSDRVSREAAITPLLYYADLSCGAQAWANMLMELQEQGEDRATCFLDARTCPYSLSMLRKALDGLYGSHGDSND